MDPPCCPTWSSSVYSRYCVLMYWVQQVLCTAGTVHNSKYCIQQVLCKVGTVYSRYSVKQAGKEGREVLLGTLEADHSTDSLSQLPGLEAGQTLVRSCRLTGKVDLGKQ